MNYCEKIHYTILSTKRAEFAVMVDDLLSQLPQNEVIMRLAFFGTPGTNEEYVAPGFAEGEDPSVLWGLRTGFELCLPTAAERSFVDGGT